MDGLIAYVLAKSYMDKVGQSILSAGFKVQVETDRSILETAGQEKILYLIPKLDSSSSDGYDEYIYTNNTWEYIGFADVDLSEYATKSYVTDEIEDAQEVYSGNVAPTGAESIWIDTSQTPSQVKFKINNTWTNVVTLLTNRLNSVNS